MPTVTVSVDDDLKKQMNDHPEINWSEVARQSFRGKLDELGTLERLNQVLDDSQLTHEDVDELAELVNEGATERLARDAESPEA